jgi:hypothetical protein
MERPLACYALAMTWVYTLQLPTESNIDKPLTVTVTDSELGRRSPETLIVS